jgi:hypothetical protein
VTAVERCKSCGAGIRWAKWASSGRWVPLDVDAKPDGNVVLVARRGMERVESFNKDSAEHAKLKRYVSHFATCPKADEHRRPRA